MPGYHFKSHIIMGLMFHIKLLLIEMQENNETMSHEYTMNVASNLGLSGPESLVPANWAYNPR